MVRLVTRKKMNAGTSEAWERIRAGEESGVLRLHESFVKDSPEDEAKFLSCAYLWLGRTEKALELLTNAPETDAELSALLGAAKWCEGHYEEAIQLWSSRMTLHEPKSAPARRLALLLMAGAELRGDGERRRQAQLVLAKTISEERPSDIISALVDVALVSCKPDTKAFALSKREMALVLWLATFYCACDALVGNFIPSMDLPHLREAELKGAMSEVVAYVQTNAMSIKEFISRVSWPELFLARHTLSKGAIIPEMPVGASPVSELLEGGHRSEGLSLALANYRNAPVVGNVRSLGFAYLLQEEYSAAWKLCQEALRTQRWTSSIYFEIAGTAQWCLNDPAAAIESWKAGMGAQYGDAAGGARVRLLLFVASVLRPDAISRNQARKLLEKKRSQKRIGSWPGQLVRLCLDELEIDFELEKAKSDLQHRKWEIAFYSILTRFRDLRIDSDELSSTFQQLVTLPGEPQAGHPGLGDVLRAPEYYIARYESKGLRR